VRLAHLTSAAARNPAAMLVLACAQSAPPPAACEAMRLRRVQGGSFGNIITLTCCLMLTPSAFGFVYQFHSCKGSRSIVEGSNTQRGARIVPHPHRGAAYPLQASKVVEVIELWHGTCGG
jgi:hypothetical protein